MCVDVDAVYNERHAPCNNLWVQYRRAGTKDAWSEERFENPSIEGAAVNDDEDGDGDGEGSQASGNYEFNFVLNDLKPEKEYEIRLRGDNRVGPGAWSNSGTFKTIGFPQDLGEVGPTELLLERHFRPPKEHFFHMREAASKWGA